MATVHHFTYGAFNPVAAYLLAFLGSLLGLLCARRARAARTRSRRNRWLVIAAIAIGGGAIWLMHFTAMLGFEVPQSPLRYSPGITVLSLLIAVLAVGGGLIAVGHPGRGRAATVVAGLCTGGGIIAMHYTGMAGMHLSARVHYRPTLVTASVLIAVVAATAALHFATAVRGWGHVIGAAALMGGAVCGMHYTAMAAMRVELTPLPPEGVTGIRPLLMIVPITVVTAATMLGVALCALQAMTDEEFTDGAGTPRRGVHAEPPQPWSLRAVSLHATRRPPTLRPSPRPTPRPAPRPLPSRPGPARPPAPAGTPVANGSRPGR